MNLWQNSRFLNLLANMLFGATTLAVLMTAGLWLGQRSMFTLAQVDVEPAPGTVLRHAQSAQLRRSAQMVARGSFFGVELDAVRAGFEAVPWVRHASVRRVWPNRLQVEIEEHRPMAVWGESQLVNTFGEVYNASVVEAEREAPLPQFSGPPGSEAMVVRRYEELRLWLADIGRVPDIVTLSPRYAWTVVLDDDTTLMLGRDQGVPIEERVKRFAAVYPGVQARLDRKAELIDLRYPNGFAIRAVSVVAADGTKAMGKDDLSIAKLNHAR